MKNKLKIKISITDWLRKQTRVYTIWPQMWLLLRNKLKLQWTNVFCCQIPDHDKHEIINKLNKINEQDYS